MNNYRADLHIHTVLSPCGDLEMSPANIVDKAKKEGLNIIGITDHNSTRHCKLISKLAEPKGIFVLMGAEVTTREEVHCLTFFENDDQLSEFQLYLEEHLPPVPNNTDKFGYQVVVDENEKVINEIEFLLLSALDQSIEQIEQKVHSLGGIFIPAHIDRPSYSIISQLGFIPTDLWIDGIEISAHCKIDTMAPFLDKHSKIAIIRNSDAHYVENIGNGSFLFKMEQPNFNEVKLALKGMQGRNVIVA
jgi:3',5'-nucleoside bisphosphate phosphatase